MLHKPYSLGNLFSDRSSLVLRTLLRDAGKKWTVPELAKEGVSVGLAHAVLVKAEALGYVERILKGRGSYTRLIRKEELLKDWIRNYSFEKNPQAYYLTIDKDFLGNLKRYLDQKNIGYALTLYSASRLIASPYVKDDRHFIYLDIGRGTIKSFLYELTTQLNLYEVVRRGNVCFAIPFYRSSVFKNVRLVKGFPVVSNLQLYLDLMSFPPTGAEEAQHLAAHFKKRNASFV